MFDRTMHCGTKTLIGREQKAVRYSLTLANARPDADFRYRSKANARSLSENATLVLMRHGRNFDVCDTSPELCFCNRTRNARPWSLSYGAVAPQLTRSQTDGKGRGSPSRSTLSMAKAGGAGESRTPDTQFRKLLLYPSELQPQVRCPDFICKRRIGREEDSASWRRVAGRREDEGAL